MTLDPRVSRRQAGLLFTRRGLICRFRASSEKGRPVYRSDDSLQDLTAVVSPCTNMNSPVWGLSQPTSSPVRRSSHDLRPAPSPRRKAPSIDCCKAAPYFLEATHDACAPVRRVTLTPVCRISYPWRPPRYSMSDWTEQSPDKSKTSPSWGASHGTWICPCKHDPVVRCSGSIADGRSAAEVAPDIVAVAAGVSGRLAPVGAFDCRLNQAKIAASTVAAPTTNLPKGAKCANLSAARWLSSMTR